MSPPVLTRLVYASRRAAGPVRDLDAEVRDILIASINNNRSCAITGLLISHRDWFLQALEGPPEAVARTYAAIRGDARHHDTLVVEEAQVSARTFFRWTMCACAMSDADVTILAKLVDGAAFDPFSSGPGAALDLLRTVAELHGDLLVHQHTELMGEILRAA